MKKILISLMLVFIAFYTNAQMNKVAVISLSANKGLTTVGFNDVALNASDYVFQGQGFNISEELTRFKTYLFEDLSKEFPFELIDESEIINNEDFKALKEEYENSNIAKLSKRSPAEGYSTMLGLSKEKKAKLAEIFPEANAFMIVYVDYSIAAKTMIGGNGKAGGKAKAQIDLYVPSGKRIMNLGATGMSKQGFAVVAEQITSNRDKIPVALKQASDKMFEDMKGNLPKRIKKMKKKLAKLED